MRILPHWSYTCSCPEHWSSVLTGLIEWSQYIFTIVFCPPVAEAGRDITCHLFYWSGAAAVLSVLLKAFENVLVCLWFFGLLWQKAQVQWDSRAETARWQEVLQAEEKSTKTFFWNGISFLTLGKMELFCECFCCSSWVLQAVFHALNWFIGARELIETSSFLRGSLSASLLCTISVERIIRSWTSLYLGWQVFITTCRLVFAS